MGKRVLKEKPAVTTDSGGSMPDAKDIISLIQSKQDAQEFQELHWRGNFEEYLNLVISDPDTVRSAFQRIYDMILSHGVEEYTEHKKKIISLI